MTLVQKAEDQLAFPNVTKVGEPLPADLSLTNSCSGKVINLENVWNQSKFAFCDAFKFYF